ncbi:MMPL family transporter [Streptomyces tateyamensis]|uniref:MMPL family transporter n=1 Tax=Streptomyces tateyamensis TaxID=565073 RepID=A0A2V4PSQ8_9ACTN|nr:MMPL family transporter [Streptomyces tateyamensis]PYC88115.1 MMPL family transporter [Streptomyces tateyamensis]
MRLRTASPATPAAPGRLAGLGRVCRRYRRWVLAFWLVVLALGVLIGGRVFEGSVTHTAAGGAESARGSAVVAAADPSAGTVTAVVSGRPVDTPEVRQAVTAAAHDLAALPAVLSVSDYYQGGPQAAALKAQDGNGSLVTVKMADSATAKQQDAVAQRLKAVQAPGAQVAVGGDLVVQQQVKAQTQSDTTFGELVTLPLTLVVMVLVFGGLAAASLPVIGAVASVGGALLAMFGFSRIMDLDTSVLPIATVLGLGLSIDYALLMVNRFREERGAGVELAAAIERTAATAGRTVAFSGLTVAVALSGLFVFRSPVFRAVAAAGVSVVVIAVLAALTLVPALLGFAGHRIKPPKHREPDEGFFARTVRRVQRRAVPVALVCVALLMAAGAPFLSAEMRSTGVGALPASSSGRQVAQTIQQQYPQAAPAPVTVVVEAGAQAAQQYADTVVAKLPGVSGVRAVQPVGSGKVSTVEVLVPGDPQGGAAKHVVEELRAERGGLTTYVTGDAAGVVDFQHELVDRGPWALGLVAVGTLVLLFLMTGSVVMPVKALAMNVLSLGASLGALTLVFQHGWFAGALGFTPTGGLETFIPVLVFAFAFGLSMDYEVFLLARIKELTDQGYGCRQAVQLGLQRSGRIITSAALLMVIVFAGFAAGQMLMVKQMGIALAVAVAVDATLVRCLLVPATMSFFGEFNWWAPAPLKRLYRRYGLREHVELPPAAPVARPAAGAGVVPAPRAPRAAEPVVGVR